MIRPFSWPLAVVIGTAAIFGLSYSLTTPLLALDLTARGYGSAAIGLNAALHACGVLATAPFLPRLARMIGGPRLVTVALAGTGVILWIGALAPPVWVLFVIRPMLGSFAEMLFVMSETWASQLSAEAARGRIMAVYTAATALGFAGGPLILSVVGAEGPAAYLAGAAIGLVAAILFAAARVPPPSFETAPRSLRHYARLASVALAATALNAAVETAGLSFLPLYAMRHGWSEDGGVRLMAILLFGAIVLQLPVGWLADRLDRRAMAGWFALAAGIGALTWPFVLPVPWLAYAVLFAWGGAFVGIYTLTLAVVGGTFEGTDLIGVYGCMGVTWGLGALLGPAATGLATGATTGGLPLVVAASCLLFALLALSRRRHGGFEGAG